MNTLTPEPVSNETRIRQIADELREMLKTDNDAPRLIHLALKDVEYVKPTGGRDKEIRHLGWKLTSNPPNL